MRTFLLSPANCGGQRGVLLLSPKASFPLALALRSGEGAPIGEVFSFISGLYFRGKLAYARRFAGGANGTDGPARILVITPGAGLRTPETPVTVDAVRRFAKTSVDLENGAYRRPLERAARALRAELGTDDEVVLLGSIASPKYVDLLTAIFGERLLFPVAFVGRGDMSRGGLMLRHAAAGVELDYVPVLGSVRHGKRPAKLGVGSVSSGL